jgi:hypothetical protein
MHALIDGNGQLVQTIYKPTPFVRIEAGFRLVGFNPPEVDAQNFTADAVVPVPADAQEVAFVVNEIPGRLDRAKVAKRAAINTAWLAANADTFLFEGAQISVNTKSRGDIDAINGYVAVMGELPRTWPGGWKGVNNTVVPIPDIQTWRRFYAAMVNTGTEYYAHAQDLKARVDAASTPDEVAGVPDW